jgi:hypothetical protein
MRHLITNRCLLTVLLSIALLQGCGPSVAAERVVSWNGVYEGSLALSGNCPLGNSPVAIQMTVAGFDDALPKPTDQQARKAQLALGGTACESATATFERGVGQYLYATGNVFSVRCGALRLSGTVTAQNGGQAAVAAFSVAEVPSAAADAQGRCGSFPAYTFCCNGAISGRLERGN